MTPKALTEHRIAEVFDQDIARYIEPVIQIQADNNDKLAQEIQEYVVTAAIRDHVKALLQNYLDQQERPTQKIGVWVSGFFGSGKSSFAKMIGYALENRTLGDETVRDKLRRRFGGDDEIRTLFDRLDALEQHRPARAIVFDLAKDAVRSHEFVSQAMYIQLLREFNYPDSPELAALELQLEREGRYPAFKERFQALYDLDWEGQKNSLNAKSRASAVLHELEPQTYPAKDSWAKTSRTIPESPAYLTNRAIEMTQRRGNNANLIFVIDEVGQFASRNELRLLDLQGVVQSFDDGGTALGENRSETGVMPGSFRGRLWLLVTSQEALDSVVENLDSKRTELQRLQDRFQNPIDLKPTDITEVTKQRLLKKKSTLEPAFQQLYDQHAGSLKLHTRLDSAEQRELNTQSFTDLYPLLPYQFDLLIDIIGTIRSQGQAGATYGAAVRPVLAMVRDLLNDDTLALDTRDVGKIVTFDEVYDILDHRIRTDLRDSIDQISSDLGPAALATRVAKALVLLSMTRRGVKKTLRSLSATLYSEIGANSRETEVQAALQKLEAMERIGLNDGEYEFLSQEARNWESERNAIDPGNKLREEIRKVIIASVARQTYNHKGLKTFQPTLLLDGTPPLGSSKGDITLRLDTLAADPDHAYVQSNQHQQDICSVIPITRTTEDAATQLWRSRTMIERYERDDSQAQNITRERQRLSAAEVKLSDDLAGAIMSAKYYFRGQDISPTSDNINRLVAELFEPVVDKVFPKLSDLTITPKSEDLRMLFTQDTLTAMNELLGPSGLDVLRTEAGKPVLDANAAIFRDLKQFVEQRTQSGQTPNGLALTQTFNEAPYGWSQERVRYLVAALFRAGALEVHAQADRFTSYADPGAQDIFETLAKFRQAQFLPRDNPIDTMEVFNKYTELTGDPIDSLDEAILAAGVRKYIGTLATRAITVVSRLKSHNLPGAATLGPVSEALDNIRNASSSDEVLKLFLANVSSIQEHQSRIDTLAERLGGNTLRIIEAARHATKVYYPALQTKTETIKEAYQKLQSELSAESFIERLSSIEELTRTIEKAVERDYQNPWLGRFQKYTRTIEELQADAGYQALPEDEQDRYLSKLKRYRGDTDTPPEHVWQQLNPTIDHLNADTHAAENRLRDILKEIRQALEPEAAPPTTISLKSLRIHLDPDDPRALEQLDAHLVRLKNNVEAALKRGEHVVLE
ncbi:MAG: BREX system P-loop protein BrxC [Trueperaceae bacterium]|nr:BREX system P-loop protein BrxC [Trueperaceae bacterium]